MIQNKLNTDCKQLKLEPTCNQLALNVKCFIGTLTIPDGSVSPYAWLFGDDTVLLFGDGSEITYA